MILDLGVVEFLCYVVRVVFDVGVVVGVIIFIGWGDGCIGVECQCVREKYSKKFVVYDDFFISELCFQFLLKYSVQCVDCI